MGKGGAFTPGTHKTPGWASHLIRCSSAGVPGCRRVAMETPGGGGGRRALRMKAGSGSLSAEKKTMGENI